MIRVYIDCNYVLSQMGDTHCFKFWGSLACKSSNTYLYRN